MKENNNKHINGDSSLQDKPTSGTVPLGILYAVAAAMVSGVSIFYNKTVVVKGIDPLIFNILKNGGVAFILSIVLLLRRPHQLRSALAESKDTPWLKLMLIGLIGGSIPFLLFFEGLVNVPAVNANLIQKSLFIFVAILAVTYLKERISPLQIVGYLLVLYANFFIGGLKGFSFNIYEGMILSATLFWAVENIIAKKAMSKTDSLTASWGRMFFGLIVLLLMAAVSGKANMLTGINVAQILPITGSIALLTLYVTFWYKALKLAPATQVSAILILATPVTNILSAVFITRDLNAVFTLNTYLLIAGISFIGFNMKNFIKNVRLLPKKA